MDQAALAALVRRAVVIAALLENRLPPEAPELYADRQDRNENGFDFTVRVYGRWIGNGLDLSHIRRVDRALYRSIQYRKHYFGVPEGSPIAKIPTKSQAVDMALASGQPPESCPHCRAISRFWSARFYRENPHSYRNRSKKKKKVRKH